jgi:hypothetical protein
MLGFSDSTRLVSMGISSRRKRRRHRSTGPSRERRYESQHKEIKQAHKLPELYAPQENEVNEMKNASLGVVAVGMGL